MCDAYTRRECCLAFADLEQGLFANVIGGKRARDFEGKKRKILFDWGILLESYRLRNANLKVVRTRNNKCLEVLIDVWFKATQKIINHNMPETGFQRKSSENWVFDNYLYTNFSYSPLKLEKALLNVFFSVIARFVNEIRAFVRSKYHHRYNQ